MEKISLGFQVNVTAQNVMSFLVHTVYLKDQTLI